MRIIDTHCDTLYMRALQEEQRPCVTLEAMRAGGMSVQTCTLFAGSQGPKGHPYEKAMAQVAALNRLQADGWKRVDSPLDAKDGECAVLMSLEGGEILEDRLERVAEFRGYGARLVALTWNNENLIASPAKGGSKEGIKPFGWAVLGEMARLNMAADTSHLNERGFWDLIERHAHPPMASHSCCAKLHPHFRNLTDEQLKALIERGGWVGINFYPAFLTGGEATVEDIVRHIDHVVQMGGEKNVGFGSDFDGIERTPVDCAGPQDFPKILDALRRLGYPEETVRGIAGENFIEYFKKIEA